jgi:hypothetical protein
MSGELRFGGADDRSDAAAFLGRVVRLDPAALVRLRTADASLTLWAWLPFEVLVARTVRAHAAERDLTVPGKALLDAVTADGPAVPPPRRDEGWRGALPADGPGEVLDEVPADVVARLLEATEQTFRAASAGADPRAVGDALLDHEVLTVSGAGHTVAVPLRALLACARMGFIGGGPIRVAVTGGWVRIGASFGSAYVRRGGRLALFPAGR